MICILTARVQAMTRSLVLRHLLWVKIVCQSGTLGTKRIDMLSKETTLSKLVCSLLKRGLPQKNKICSKGEELRIRSKIFSFRVDPFSDETWFAGKHTGSHKSCLSFKMAENKLKYIRFRNIFCLQIVMMKILIAVILLCLVADAACDYQQCADNCYTALNNCRERYRDRRFRDNHCNRAYSNCMNTCRRRYNS